MSRLEFSIKIERSEIAYQQSSSHLLSPTLDKVSSPGSCVDNVSDIMASDPPAIAVMGSSIVAHVGSATDYERH